MDKRALKSLIIELKESNISYQEISNILEKDYNIHMSRQAVCGMYTRATSDKTLNKNKELILATEDIVNYNNIGLDNREIKAVLDSIGYQIAINDIKYIIEINSEYIKALERELVYKVSKGITSGDDVQYIRNKIVYKSIKVTENRFKTLLNLATEQLIVDSVTKVLSNVYDITDDKQLVREAIAQHNLNITLKYIENKHRENKIVNKLVIDDTMSNIIRPRYIGVGGY